MFEGTRSLLNLIIGICLIILGGLQLVILLGLVSFTFPEIPKILLEIFLAVAGLYLMIDGIMVLTMHPVLTLADIVFGLAIASMGMIPLLNDLFGLFFPMPFINEAVIYSCFLLAGIVMVINSWNF
jgi:hypothetical protein